MRRRSLVGAACLVVALTAPLLAQPESAPTPPSPDEVAAALPLDQRFSTLLNRGRYLEAFKQYEAADPTQIGDGLRSTYRQMRPMLDGFFYVDPAAPALPPADAADVAAYGGAVAHDAIEAILARAGDSRIVIVNEAHDSPRDRAFILKLAEALKPLGFTHYAAETFTNYPADISAAVIGRLEDSGYPARNTGFASSARTRAGQAQARSTSSPRRRKGWATIEPKAYPVAPIPSTGCHPAPAGAKECSPRRQPSGPRTCAALPLVSFPQPLKGA